MIQAAIYQHLITDAGVTSLVEQRVYPIVLPERCAQPSIAYQRTSVERGKTYCGTDALLNSAVQLDCYAKDYLTANQLASAVATSLIDFSGDMHGTPVNTISLETELDLSDIEPGLFRISMTFSIWHN